MEHQSFQAPKRPYRKRRRAESEDRTRQRITAAAVALHQTVGPARTSVKSIAERAGVDRATVYRHFPDEQALFDACTTHYYSRHPMPDPGNWRAIAEPEARLNAALTELYAWFAETEEMLTRGIRDIESVPEGTRAAFLGYFESVQAALMTGRRQRGRPRARVAAAVAVAISFPTWRTLVRERQLSTPDAVELMTAMIKASAARGG